jgi:CheY-like chemotaxis protein
VSVLLRVDPGGTTATISVRDTGVGMTAETLERLFIPFSQAEGERPRTGGGLGLGLALIKGLVEAHGGSIEARSAGPGQGSEFRVRLPLHASLADAAEAAVDDGEAVADSPRRILLVEDNADVAESTRILLEVAGHEVRIARDAKSALEQAREFEPQIVICDIGLPGPMSGYDVAQAIRADSRLSSSYLIALTGIGREEQQALLAGFDIHVMKPADPAQLRRLLARVPRRS